MERAQTEDRSTPAELGPPVLSFFGPSTHVGARLLVLPALSTPARSYTRLADALAALGFAGAVLEWPGTGAHPMRPGRGRDWGYRQLLELQVLPAMQQLADRASATPVILLGHSLGAHLAFMVRARDVANLAAIVTIAAGTPYYRVFRFPARHALIYLIVAVAVFVPLLGYFPGRLLGFAGSEPRTLMTEWARLAQRGRLLLDGKDALHADGPRHAIPVRALVLNGDRYAPYAATVHLLGCAGLPESAARRVDDPKVRGHFQWLCAPEASARLIAAEIRALPVPGA